MFLQAAALLVSLHQASLLVRVELAEAGNGDSGCQLASLAACLDSLVTLLQIFQSAPFGLSYPLTQSAHYEETVFLSEYVVIN